MNKNTIIQKVETIGIENEPCLFNTRTNTIIDIVNADATSYHGDPIAYKLEKEEYSEC